MRLRHIALGCTLTGALGFLGAPPATAAAESTVRGDSSVLTRTMVNGAILRLDAPVAVARGANVVISGRLTFAVAKPPARTRITITRTGAGTAKKTFIEHTETTGDFAFTDHNLATGRYTYTAVFAGDAIVTPAQATATVTVKGVRPRLSISSPATNYRYGAVIRLTVTLGSTVKDRRVSLYASPYGERRRLVATSDVNAHGKWYPVYRIGRKTTLTVVFAGDSHNAPNSAHITVGAYAQVADRLTGYFKTAKINGLTYDVYHGSGTLTLYSTVTPDKHGQCLQPESEQYKSGKTWYADTKYGCDTLDRTSHDTAPFVLNMAVGDRYRIRGDYFRNAKDLGNLNRQGQWLYFEVVH
jgi:hypothetical protein